jgi:hypothetical protein
VLAVPGRPERHIRVRLGSGAGLAPLRRSDPRVIADDVRVVTSDGGAYAPGMCLIVYLVARGVAFLVSRLSERRGGKPPRDARDDEWVLVA